MNWNKILFLTSEFPPQPGGIGKHAHDLSLALAAQEKSITVLCDIRSKDGKEEHLFDDQLPFLVKRIKRNSWLFWTYLQRMYTALRLMKDNDGILVSGKFSIWMIFLLKSFSRKPCVAIIHGTEIQLPKKYQRRFTNSCLRKCEGVIAVSNYTASLVNQLQLERLQVIPNGIFPPMSTDLHEKPATLQLITVGNLTQRKGQHNVIKLLPELQKHFPQVHYHMVGLPTEKESLETLAKRIGVLENITVHGRLIDKDKERLLNKSSIFIMLSEQTKSGDVEGFGIAILEANALGLPAIGASGCGIEDAIADGVSGFLVALGNTRLISEKIIELVKAYPVFSQQAISWSQQFHWDKIVQQYLTFIHETTTKNS